MHLLQPFSDFVVYSYQPFQSNAGHFRIDTSPQSHLKHKVVHGCTMQAATRFNSNFGVSYLMSYLIGGGGGGERSWPSGQGLSVSGAVGSIAFEA